MSYHIVDSATKINDFEKEHSKKPMVVWYYADWCGHCTDMEPAWNDYKDKCKNLKVSLAKVNADIIKYLKKDPEVRGFPTIEFHNKGQKTAEFNENRNSEDLLNFTKKNLKLVQSEKPKKSKRRKSNSNIKPTKKRKSNKQKLKRKSNKKSKKPRRKTM